MAKTRLVHVMKEEYDIAIDRSGKWGNPYSERPGTWAKYTVATREEAVAKYREYILSNQELLDSLHELKGKRLGCWRIPGKPCNGDVLLELIKERLGEDE